jgi:hypothetical protein
MNPRSLLLIVPALVFFAAAAHAEETAAPPAAQPAVEEPKAPPAAPEAKPEAKPEVKPVPPAVPAEKPLHASAARFQPVVDSYQQAHDSLLAWLRKASAKMEVVDGKIADLKEKIAAKGAKETGQKLDAVRKGEPPPNTMDAETHGLWNDLKAQEARRKELSQALSAAAGQKVQDFNRAVTDALSKASAENP